MVPSAWGEVREGFSNIKPQRGFESQRGIYQLDKERETASQPEETAGAKARKHEGTGCVGRTACKSVPRALPEHGVQRTEQRGEAKQAGGCRPPRSLCVLLEIKRNW